MARYPRNKSAKIAAAVQFMWNNPRPKISKRAEKAWREIAPPEEGWFFAQDIGGKGKLCESNETSTLRKYLEETDLIEGAQISWEDPVKHRTTHRYTFRLRRTEWQSTLKYIFNDPGLYEAFFKNKNDYGKSLLGVLELVMRLRASSMGANRHVFDPRQVDCAILDYIISENPDPRTVPGIDCHWTTKMYSNWVLQEMRHQTESRINETLGMHPEHPDVQKALKDLLPLLQKCSLEESEVIENLFRQDPELAICFLAGVMMRGGFWDLFPKSERFEVASKSPPGRRPDGPPQIPSRITAGDTDENNFLIKAGEHVTLDA